MNVGVVGCTGYTGYELTKLVKKHPLANLTLLCTRDPSEILKDLENRHQEVDGFVNALPTTCFEKAFDRAARFEKMEGKKFLDTCRPLFGLPIPIKDSYNVAGVRTTYGSKAYENYIPDSSDICSEHFCIF